MRREDSLDRYTFFLSFSVDKINNEVNKLKGE